MQLFSADATMFLNIYFLNFLPPKTWKNLLQKLLIIGPDSFFSVLAAGCTNGPKTEIPYHQKPLNAGLGI